MNPKVCAYNCPEKFAVIPYLKSLFSKILLLPQFSNIMVVLNRKQSEAPSSILVLFLHTNARSLYTKFKSVEKMPC